MLVSAKCDARLNYDTYAFTRASVLAPMRKSEQADTESSGHMNPQIPLSTRLRSWVPNVLGVAWVLAAAFAVLLPALVHGASLGPYDVLSQYSLSKQSGVTVHNWRLIDQGTAIIPWTTLAWTQVHGGHLPLWNPYSLLGMPLAFNWLSAPFSVASLIGYLVPLHLDYTVQIIVTFVITGTGVYVLGKVLGLGVLGCAMAATICELSGPYIAWLGSPLLQVMSWAGWLFAAAILIVRGRHRTRNISFFAVVLACMIYAGFPEGAVLLGMALALFLTVLLALRARGLGGAGNAVRPVVDLAVAAVAGAALGAPLALPGLQLAAHSTRGLAAFTRALPTHSLVGVVFQGFDGLPEASSQWFGGGGWFPLYMEAYVGVIAVVLAVAAVALRRHKPEVVAFGVVVAVTAGLCFLSPLVRLIQGLPFHLGRVQWAYALMPMVFAIAVLAGVGTDVVVRAYRERAVQKWVGGGFVVMGVLVLTVWIFGRGGLPPVEARIRAQSFIWPTISVLLGLGLIGTLAIAHRRAGSLQVARHRRAGRWAGMALLACESAFLVASGAPFMSSSPTFLAPTPAEVALQRAVGPAVVGCGAAPCWTALGILPDLNVVYRIQELAVYDPSTPVRYLKSWRAATGEYGQVDYNIFSPKVMSDAIARRYGIGFVLEPAGIPGPTGAVFDMKVGNEALYRIPGAAVATLTPGTSTGALPTADAAGTPVAVTHPDPASWRITTDAATRQVLRLRLTDVPGWHGSIDGHPLKLYPFSGVMLQARIPPGRHIVELRYWPSTLTSGIALATGSAAALLLTSVLPLIRRRWRDGRGAT